MAENSYRRSTANDSFEAKGRYRHVQCSLDGIVIRNGAIII